jgi:hypothetical protein
MITYEEMNVYLASIGGLNRTYREDKGPILDSKAFGVGEGWLHLIKDMIEELIALGWDKRLLQCKEKFGGLRFYIETYPEGGQDVISKYEKLSHETCEECGIEASPSKINGWIHTLCDVHAEEHKKTKEDVG